MTYQLAPPNDHHRTIVKKAIHTFKAHFISILCWTVKSFPLQLWCQLLPQAEHTLNMLCLSRMTPNVSAYAYLWGQHGYNANPYTPLGCKVELYLYPGPSGKYGRHIQPAVATLENCRNITNFTRYTSPIQGTREFVIPCSSNISISQCPPLLQQMH